MRRFLKWLANWWWRLWHPKKTILVHEKKFTHVPVNWAPRRRKEDPKTKKRRKMAEASRKINRKK